VERGAHQLKGAAGSYGFDQLTPLAAALEFAVRDNESEAAVQQAFEALIEACCQVRTGSS
jgi:HPt (histidine-containing phosphotransfer) domain-containing protein